MSWIRFTDNAGQNWEYNVLGLWILCRQHVYNELLKDRSHIQRDHHRFCADTFHVQTNFSGIRQEREQKSRQLFERLEHKVANDTAGTFDELVRHRVQTLGFIEYIQRLQATASGDTTRSINASVANAQNGADMARFVRDSSVTVLLVGASVMSGGAAAGALGAGSFMSGAFAYQDTGDLGVATMTGVGTLGVGLMTMAFAPGSLAGSTSVSAAVRGGSLAGSTAAAGLTGRQQLALTVVTSSVDATVEGSTAMMQGATGQQALNSAATRFMVSMSTAGLGVHLDDIAMPAIGRMSAEFLSVTAGNALVNATHPGSGPDQLPTPTGDVCDINTSFAEGASSHAEWVRRTVLRRA